METHCRILPGGKGDGRQAPRLGAGGGDKGNWQDAAPRLELRLVPGKGSQSPFSLSHITPRLSEIWGLFSSRAA